MRWTENDFDAMNWHDNHIHGFSVVEGQYGSGSLVLDLDINYAKLTAAMAPFSISGIQRTAEHRGRYTAQIWRLELNFPDGFISFAASGFTQAVWGKTVVSDEQRLHPHERIAVQ